MLSLKSPGERPWHRPRKMAGLFAEDCAVVYTVGVTLFFHFLLCVLRESPLFIYPDKNPQAHWRIHFQVLSLSPHSKGAMERRQKWTPPFFLSVAYCIFEEKNLINKTSIQFLSSNNNRANSNLEREAVSFPLPLGQMFLGCGRKCFS